MTPSPALVALVRAAYDALSSDPAAFFEHHLAEEVTPLIIGTAPDEWWSGREAILETVRTQSEGASGIAVRASAPAAFETGDTGWIIDRPSFHLPDGRRVPARLTVACHREHGQWRIAVWHISLGVDNAVLGTT